ncbi:MAG: hypothetical protein ACEQSU_09440 [Microgenomates group bacterium]
MAEKKWADRLPLNELRGCILFGAAIWLRLRTQQSRRESLDSEPSEFGLSPPLWQLEKSHGDLAEEILTRLDLLGASAADWEVAKEIRFCDYRFHPENLFNRPYLTFIVMPKASRYYSQADNFTPISRNLEGDVEEMTGLFMFWSTYHAAPSHAKPSLACELNHLGFPQTPEHFHFLNYVAAVCEEPQGKGRPSGSGYNDASHYAARLAFHLIKKEKEKGRQLSNSEALRRSLALFKIVGPTPELLNPEAAGERDELIVASSPEQAEKRVRKLLEELLSDEET